MIPDSNICMYVHVYRYIYTHTCKQWVAVEHQQPITEVYLYSRRRGITELPVALQSIIDEKYVFVNEDRCLDKVAIFIQNMCHWLMRSSGQSGAEEPALGCDGGWEKWQGCSCHPPALCQKKPPENTYPRFTFKSSGCSFQPDRCPDTSLFLSCHQPFQETWWLSVQLLSTQPPLKPPARTHSPSQEGRAVMLWHLTPLRQRDPAERSKEITSKPQPEADKQTDI